jgi:hypothetical protein
MDLLCYSLFLSRFKDEQFQDVNIGLVNLTVKMIDSGSKAFYS